MAFQCAGRVSEVNYLEDDDEEFPRDAFCDVRFDRIDVRTNQTKPPKKMHCYATGKILCKDCCRFFYPINEWEKDPSQPKECKQGMVPMGAKGLAVRIANVSANHINSSSSIMACTRTNSLRNTGARTMLR